MENMNKSKRAVRRDGTSGTKSVGDGMVKRNAATSQSPPVYFEKAVSRRDVNAIMRKLAKL